MTPRPHPRLPLWRIAACIALAAGILLPLAQTVLLSFIATLPHEGVIEGEISLINYRNIFATPALTASIAGLPAAYAFSRYRFVGDRHFLFLMLAFRVTPPVVLSLPIFILFAQFGLVNSPVGIALVHCLFNLPIAIWILESFISAIPREFDETAFLDGHSTPSFFLRHLIPAPTPRLPPHKPAPPPINLLDTAGSTGWWWRRA